MKAGPGAAGLVGRMGGQVFYEVDGERLARAWVRPTDPRSEAQLAQRRRTERAARGWGELDDAGRERWRDYARTNGGEGRAYALFRSLAMKRLRLDAAVDLAAFEPPRGAFLGDSVRVVASGGAMGAVFEASGANGLGVATELLTQRLAARHVRSHPEKYRSLGFVAFAGAGGHVVGLAPGAWATAHRFVDALTGQETGLAETGVVVVG